jgi:pseudouridine synthase
VEERLQKVLAHAGVASRRAVEEMISAGRIAVNGRTARLGQKVDPEKDEVEVDGSRVPLKADLVWYLLNKPTGVVTTASDPDGRTTVLDLIDAPTRVWPVGRLDIDSEGAVIVTNDGDLTQRLTHPSYEVPRTYLVEVGGGISEPAMRRLASGVELDDGAATPIHVRLVQRHAGAALVEMTIAEGRNRQVRRMIEAVGGRVTRLVRVSIGPLMLGRLKPGTARRLAPAEVRSLYKAADL